MRLTVAPQSKRTHVGKRDVVEDEITPSNVVPKEFGLEVKLSTKHLALSGHYIARLQLEWEEVELLAKIAAGVDEQRRRELLQVALD
ncbi:MAG: hypothetical protein E5Y35_06125, partial [Mesorhizobium sp.]